MTQTRRFSNNFLAGVLIIWLILAALFGFRQTVNAHSYYCGHSYTANWRGQWGDHYIKTSYNMYTNGDHGHIVDTYGQYWWGNPYLHTEEVRCPGH